MCNLHWCYTFCTGVTLFALVLHLNCTALSQSESSNFFMYIISCVICTACVTPIVNKKDGICVVHPLIHFLRHLPLKCPREQKPRDNSTSMVSTRHVYPVDPRQEGYYSQE